MEYAHRIQLALDFIETHLTEALSLAEVADQAAFSSWHFQRLFSTLTGEPLKTYIRKRRLSAAAVELMQSKQRILAIALKYRFESQAAFTRAFRAQFGCPPGQFRLQPRRLQAPLLISNDYIKHLSGGLNMEPDIIHLDTLHVVGLSNRFISILAPEANNFEVIPALWDRFNARQGEIQGARQGVSLGLCLCEDDPSESENTGELSYLAGCLLETEPTEPLPEGMRAISIAPGQYARFTHQGELDKLQHTMSYIHLTWLPRSGYQLDQRPEIEWYDSRFKPDQADSAFDIYIPLTTSAKAE
jgi:AraC family transcriptional regulator